MPDWTCPSCESENAESNEKCECCDEDRPANAAAAAGPTADDGKAGIVVGKILEIESIASDKAKKLLIDVGAGAALTIVTVAPNVSQGANVVVAKPGAVVNDEKIKTATVYGCGSQGMLLDGQALGWKGGGSGLAALVPDSFEPGSAPPDSRPRMN